VTEVVPQHTDFKAHIPGNFVETFSADDIRQRVQELGNEMHAWCKRVWEESHTDVLALPVLRGGLFFFGDLVRALGFSVEVAPIRTQSYEPEKNGVQSASVTIHADDLAVKGRVVLVVDDICDSGRTLEALEKELLARGAREVRTVTLIRRLLDTPTFVPCWVGFNFRGPEWFVGYGMDDGERWRNLPGVYVIKKDQ
jgi:hypoxanthine phosphoribosyltransferase